MSDYLQASPSCEAAVSQHPPASGSFFFLFTGLPPHIISKKRSYLYPVLDAQKENSTSEIFFSPPTCLTECYSLGGIFMQRKPTLIALVIISLNCKQALRKHSMLFCQHISVFA